MSKAIIRKIEEELKTLREYDEGRTFENQYMQIDELDFDEYDNALFDAGMRHGLNTAKLLILKEDKTKVCQKI